MLLKLHRNLLLVAYYVKYDYQENVYCLQLY